MTTKAENNARIAQASQETGLATQSIIGRAGSPISDEAYDVIAALHELLEGLEAYRKYAADGDERFWQQMTQAELPAVEMLVQRLERLVRDGELRMRPPGETR